MGRRTALLIAAVLIAATGAALILAYVQGIDARAQQGQEQMNVLVATEEISAGELMSEALEAGKVDSEAVDSETVVEGSVRSTDQIANQVALSTIYPGEQILTQNFGQPGDRDLLTIPDNKIAISVQLTDPARVAGFVTPGSQVAIFVTAEPELRTDGQVTPLPPVTRLLLPKVLVVGVGDTTVQSTTTTNAEGEQTTEEIPRTILTLAVTQDEAEKVIYTSKYGELAFALLNAKSQVNESPGVEADDIFPESFPESFQ
jgi:pilus assembly protein CpaB